MDELLSDRRRVACSPEEEPEPDDVPRADYQRESDDRQPAARAHARRLPGGARRRGPVFRSRSIHAGARRLSMEDRRCCLYDDSRGSVTSAWEAVVKGGHGLRGTETCAARGTTSATGCWS